MDERERERERERSTEMESVEEIPSSSEN